MRSKVFVIAEAGVNHNGSPDTALELVDAAAEAGADAVKFQTFSAEQLVSSRAAKAPYQIQNTGSDGSQLEMLRRLELSADAHAVLVERCRKLGIEFLSSAFDNRSATFLVRDLKLEVLKVPSGEITNALLLLDIARLGARVIVSTGMCTLADVEEALGVLAFGYLGLGTPGRAAFRDAFASDAGQQALARNVRLLHCTTDYPARYEETNLRAMDTLAHAFGLPVGFSDHTEGIAVPIAAAARGACVIEKHFTLDRRMPGPDHVASLEPPELAAMIAGIRQVEAALGSPLKAPSLAEGKNMAIARKSLVASRPICAGEPFSQSNVTVKRPGHGIPPAEYWDVLGRVAARDFDTDDLIEY